MLFSAYIDPEPVELGIGNSYTTPFDARVSAARFQRESDHAFVSLFHRAAQLTE